VRPPVDRTACASIRPASPRRGFFAYAVLLIGPGGGTRPVGAIAAARQALDPKGVILHFRSTA
jgi:hypothetical protein